MSKGYRGGIDNAPFLVYTISINNQEREKIMAYVSQTDKKELSIGIKKVLKKYNMKGTIAVRHHSTLVVNIQSGPIEFNHTHGDGHTQVNPYWIHEHFEGVAKQFLTELLVEMKGTKYYNNDNAMVDYFDRSHYTDINIGQWNKPYVQTADTTKVYETYGETFFKEVA